MSTQRDLADPLKYSIYFVTVKLNQVIHTIPLGFTSEIYLHAYAASDVDAIACCRTWATRQNFDVARVKAVPAFEQMIANYTFPDQIINLPHTILAAELARKGIPRDRVPASRPG